MNEYQYQELRAHARVVEKKIDTIIERLDAQAVASFNAPMVVLTCQHCYCVQIAAGTCNAAGWRCCKCSDAKSALRGDE